jgi:two-component system LytT family response regulator
MKVVLVDDEPPGRLALRQQLSCLPDVEIVAECSDGASAVEAILQHAPDVLFLDVQLGGVSGLDVLERVGADAVPAVVFVTAYDRYAVRAFEAHAVDYLLKPIDPARFDEALRRSEERGRREDGQRVAQRLEQLIGVLENRVAAPGMPVTPQRIAVKEGGKVLLIDVDEISKVEADGNYLVLSLNGKSHQVRESLQAFLQRAGPGSFIRIHRSIAVNRNAVRAIETFGKGTYVLTLRDGGRVLSSYSYRENVAAPV